MYSLRSAVWNRSCLLQFFYHSDIFITMVTSDSSSSLFHGCESWETIICSIIIIFIDYCRSLDFICTINSQPINILPYLRTLNTYYPPHSFWHERAVNGVEVNEQCFCPSTVALFLSQDRIYLHNYITRVLLTLNH